MAVALGQRPALSLPAAGPDWFGDARAALDRRLDAHSSAPVAVAFSGGGDSLALLLLARAWADAAGRPPLVLTVDHRLQPQSAAWVEAAARTAERLGAGFRALAWTGDKPARGLPAAARRARHALLADAALEAGARVVLLGHTRDDVLEGELMRADGSGGLGRLCEWAPSPAWPEGRGVFLLRPLLGARRAVLRAWLADRGESWIDDPANDDRRHARARARAILSTARPGEGRDPGGPANVESVANRSAILGPGLCRDKRALEALAREADCDRFGVVRLPRAVVREAGPDAARRWLQIACLCAGGGERPARGDQTERLRQGVASGADFVATLAGARVEAAGGEVTILRDAGEAARSGLQPVTLAPGRRSIWDGRFELTAAADGLHARPLKGMAAALPPGERAGLRAVPAAARPALPIVAGGGRPPSCPLLAEDAQVTADCLVGGRLRAACGLVRTESELAPGGDGEPANGALS